MRRWTEVALGAVAWAWVLWTLYLVGRFGGAVLLDPSTTSRIMSVRNGDHIDSAVGLTYHGVGGAAVVVAELGVVAGALLLSMSRRVRLRRTSLAVLSGWALLWLGNALWMERLTGGRHANQTSLLAIIVVVLLAWAGLRWTAGASAPKGAP
jgi:hypothetical protein